MVQILQYQHLRIKKSFICMYFAFVFVHVLFKKWNKINFNFNMRAHILKQSRI